MGNLKGLKICRVFGISIEIHWSLLFIIMLVAFILAEGEFRLASPESSWILRWGAGIATALIFIFSIVFHELAHSLMAKRFKIVVKRITLFVMGGVAQVENGKNFESPVQELVIAAAGPLSSLFLAGLFFGLKSLFAPSAVAFHIFDYLSFINLLLAAFNIIPCFPMDGGRIFRAICWQKTKDFIKATKIARNAAIIFGILMTVGFFLWWGWFNGLWIGIIVYFFILPAARGEYELAMLAKRLQGVKAKDLMLRPPYGVDGRDVGENISCQPDDEAMKVLGIMNEQQARRIFVQERGTIVGVIERSQIERIMLNK